MQTYWKRMVVRQPTTRQHKTIAIMVVALLAMSSAVFAYMMGGVRLVYPHSMYFAIITGAALFGVKGGLITALVGSLLLGPLMPLDTITGEMQQTVNWIARLAFFVGVGVSMGFVVEVLRSSIKDLDNLARFDSVTALHNRTGFVDGLARTIASGARHIAVTKLTIDSYIDIYYTFGMKGWFELLQEISDRLASILPEGAVVSYISPNTFAVAVVGQEADCEYCARLIEQSFQDESFSLLGIPVHVDVTCGVACYPDNAQTSEELVLKSGIALHARKRSGESSMQYTSRLDWTDRNTMELLGRVPVALEKREFVLHYQPIYSIEDGSLRCVEALVRWNHPERGLLAPGLFLPALENTALMGTLTRWVISEGLERLKLWQEEGLTFGLAINVSPQDFRSTALAEFVESRLMATGICPSSLELEITESAMNYDLETLLSVFERFRQIGVRLSLDDFGTGQTSLDRIKYLPVHSIKIDRVFCSELSNDRRNRAIVAGALSIAAELGLEVVAEGIEEKADLDVLRQLGCPFVQGYYLCRPAAADSLGEALWKSPVHL